MHGLPFMLLFMFILLFSVAGTVQYDRQTIDSGGYSASPSYADALAFPLWDITGPTMWVPDGKCDIRDISLAATHFGSSSGDARYDARADITGSIYLVKDGKIDMRDLALIARHFGETYAGADPIVGMIAKINEVEIYNTVHSLQNLDTRVYGYPGNRLAAEYIYNRLDAIAGLVVEYQGSYQNVIATLPGTDPTSGQIYVVGAHYDSTSSDPTNAPGATDNGGGVAIVLEFARIMSQYRFDHTLKFAFWNAEENGMLGSGDFAKYAYDNNLNISLYVNFDSACYDPNNMFILDIMCNSGSLWVSDMMTEHNTLYSIGFTLTYNVHTCNSDYKSFWQYGFTAVMTHEQSHGPAHTPNDTIDKVSISYAKKNGQLGISIVAGLACLES